MTRVATIPAVTVEIGGSALSTSFGMSLAAIRVRRLLGAPAQCELSFEELPGEEPLTPIEPRSSMIIALDDAPEPLFVGEVTGIEQAYGANNLRVTNIRGYDLLYRLKKSQTIRAFRDVTATSLAEELTGRLGISVDSVYEGARWPIIIQHGQSDLELLADVCQRCGLYPVLDGDVLRLITLESDLESVRLVLGEGLFEVRIDMNDEPVSGQVEVVGWDASLVERREGQATATSAGKDNGLKLASGQGSTDLTWHFIDEAVGSDAHAGDLAQAELDRRAASEITIWAIGEGDPNLKPGTGISVEGVAENLAGTYMATSVAHTIDRERGFITEVSTNPPVPRDRPKGSITSIGIVADIEDPDAIGRIRVVLPTYGDVETEWIPVLSPGAGPGKGFMSLPEVGDRVLTIFSHEDPARAFVVGGLFGVEGPFDTGIEDGSVRRHTWLSPGGHRILLDDDTVTTRVEDTTGSFIEMSPDEFRLHSAVDLQIDAPGRALLIRSKTVDFVQAAEPEEPEEPNPMEEPDEPDDVEGAES